MEVNLSKQESPALLDLTQNVRVYGSCFKFLKEVSAEMTLSHSEDLLICRILYNYGATILHSKLSTVQKEQLCKYLRNIIFLIITPFTFLPLLPRKLSLNEQIKLVSITSLTILSATSCTTNYFLMKQFKFYGTTTYISILYQYSRFNSFPQKIFQQCSLHIKINVIGIELISHKVQCFAGKGPELLHLFSL